MDSKTCAFKLCSMQAADRYEAAWKLRSNSHAALYNWGVALSDMARVIKPIDREQAHELLRLSAEKYSLSLQWNPHNPQVSFLSSKKSTETNSTCDYAHSFPHLTSCTEGPRSASLSEIEMSFAGAQQLGSGAARAGDTAEPSRAGGPRAAQHFPVQAGHPAAAGLRPRLLQPGHRLLRLRLLPTVLRHTAPAESSHPGKLCRPLLLCLSFTANFHGHQTRECVATSFIVRRGVRNMSPRKFLILGFHCAFMLRSAIQCNFACRIQTMQFLRRRVKLWHSNCLDWQRSTYSWLMRCSLARRCTKSRCMSSSLCCPFPTSELASLLP